MPRFLKRLIRRMIVVGGSALLAAGLLLAFFAWLALQIDWQIPDAAALNSPSVLLDRDGGVIARFTGEQDRRLVTLEQVSDAAIDAVIAAEDERFYEHRGVDPASLIRAVARNVVTGSIEQGGSTLTQQYVRNAFRVVGRERTIVRKVREAVISIQLERRHSKTEILENYLNTVYFGEGAYGIEAASLTFFRKPARQLDVAEAAALAQALPAPSSRNPRVDPEGARERRDAVIDKMARHGMITPSQAERAKASPLQTQPRQPSEFRYPYFVEYVRKQLAQNYGPQAVLTGGLQVTTTIDPQIQRIVDEAVAQELPPQEGENADIEAGVVVIDPRNGDILAIHGGRNFIENQLDLATQGRRQNGSAFKPFGFVAALEEGVDPDERYRAPGSIRIRSEDCEGADPAAPTIAVSGGPGGSLRLRDGLSRSVNTVFIQVGCEVGPQRIVDTAARMGVRNEVTPNPAVAIGGPAFGASVLDMASSFATLANDGVYCPARSIRDVRDQNGLELDLPVEVTVVPDMPTHPRPYTEEERESRPDELRDRDTTRCFGAVDPDITRTTTQALERVVAETTGRRANIGRPQAGKTGTGNDERDAWFVGYTPDIAIAVWVGHRFSNEPLRNVEGFRRVQGGTIPALIWKAAAERILEGVPHTDFLEPGELAIEEGRRPGPVSTVEPQPTESSTESEEPSPTPTETEEPSPTPTETEEPSPTPSPRPSCLPLLPGCPGAAGSGPP
ncbi:MAG: penicillin-binding protein [Actinobacteria bacterium]|nr:penicillin-binding protein [Actinomycetota bacterium]